MNTITIQDFDFKFTGYGHYQVTYTSPRSGKQWSATTTDMQLVDATKNSEAPKKKDLLTLKRLCKS